MFALSTAMSLPEHSNELVDLNGNGEKEALAERATWLDTREVENDFKELVYDALRDLGVEGRIPKMVEEENSAKSKRGRYQGFCFRRTRNGRFLPYICWKGDRK